MRIAPDSEQDHGLAWLAALLHTTDSAYPIGGFAHSGGLEGLTGRDRITTAAQLRDFIQQEIADTLRYLELPLLYHTWLAATAQDQSALMELDQLSEAARFGAEPRQASRRLGAQRWSLLNTLHVAHLEVSQQTWVREVGAVLPHKHLCIVAGIEAAAMNVPASAAMMALAHQTVMMVAQASMKLIRIGQNSVQTLVADMATTYPGLIAFAMRQDLADIGVCLPRYDVGTAWHETAPARMFLS